MRIKVIYIYIYICIHTHTHTHTHIKLSVTYLFFYFIALNIHFESQCIPTALAWYAHHLPTWLLRLLTVATNVIELAIPLLFFFPNRKVRIIAFYLQVCKIIYKATRISKNYIN